MEEETDLTGEKFYNRIAVALHEFIMHTRFDNREQIIIYIPRVLTSMLVNQLWRKGYTPPPGDKPTFMGCRLLPGYENRIVIAYEDAPMYPDHILKFDIYDRDKKSV